MYCTPKVRVEKLKLTFGVYLVVALTCHSLINLPSTNTYSDNQDDRCDQTERVCKGSPLEYKKYADDCLKTLMGLLLAVRTAISTMTNVGYLALRQETTPNHLLGRVAGTSSMIMKLALPVGLFIGGIWADYLPAAPIFLISALIVLFNVTLLLKFKFHLVT